MAEHSTAYEVFQAAQDVIYCSSRVVETFILCGTVFTDEMKRLEDALERLTNERLRGSRSNG